MLERRKYVRSNGLVLVNYKIPDLKIDGKSSAFDISGIGLRITVDKKLEKGTAVEMEIYLPRSSQPLLAKGEVMWAQRCKEKLAPQIAAKNEYFFIGIKFAFIDEKNKNRITDYVSRKVHKS